MINKFNFGEMCSWIFFALVFTLGVLNLILVHPVPGVVYLLLSLVFLPPLNDLVDILFRISIPPAVKIILGIVIVWFTLGISDLAEMYGL